MSQLSHAHEAGDVVSLIHWAGYIVSLGLLPHEVYGHVAFLSTFLKYTS